MFYLSYSDKYPGVTWPDRLDRGVCDESMCENGDMSSHTLTRATTPAQLGESRSRVLAVLQDAGTSLGVAEVAHQLKLHPNTARFHLDGLVDAGLVDRGTEDRDQPGRPRTLYTARPEGARAGRDHRTCGYFETRRTGQPCR